MTTTNPSTHSNELLDISCTSGTECTAVGDTTNAESHEEPLAERWNGSSWATQATAPLSGVHLFKGVSCTSATNCMAVGYTGNSFFNFPEAPFAEEWKGTEWVQRAPVKPEGSSFPSLEGITCISSSSCTAVGEYEKEGSVHPLIETWNGSTWSLQSAPQPIGAKKSELFRVSCTASTACTAVGQYMNAEERIFTLAERWNGTEWAIQSTPNPEGETKSTLLDISCTSNSACVAVGGHQHGENTQKTLIESWNGSTWTIKTSPNPLEARATVLHGVSCSSSEACMATGDYINSAGTTVTLAENWNGSSWSILATPNPTGATFSALWSVSCLSSISCFSAGYRIEMINKTLAERYS